MERRYSAESKDSRELAFAGQEDSNPWPRQGVAVAEVGQVAFARGGRLFASKLRRSS